MCVLWCQPNMNLPKISANATLTSVRQQQQHGKAAKGSVLLAMSMGGAAHDSRGAPSSLRARITCAAGAAAGAPDTLHYALQWFNKTATHVPETIWFSSTPPLAALPGAAMRMDKLGSQIDPREADLGCDGTRTTCGVSWCSLSPAALYPPF